MASVSLNLNGKGVAGLNVPETYPGGREKSAQGC
jgi:hypothetical protein